MKHNTLESIDRRLFTVARAQLPGAAPPRRIIMLDTLLLALLVVLSLASPDVSVALLVAVAAGMAAEL